MNLTENLFKFDSLSLFIGGFACFFFLLTCIYSLGFMRGERKLASYYFYLFLTLAASLGAIFSNNFILFIVFWGFLGLLLYLLISFGSKKRTSSTAKKSFIIIGGTDALMLLGVALIWHLSHSFSMDVEALALNSKSAIFAYIFLAVGAFAKAGAMPFHSWVPDTAEDAPVPVTAFLPASLDKLLGIYFLTRMSLDIFKMSSALNTLLMAAGSFTIVAAVMMALVQRDLKRLLGYHAVSQVGYMVLGIGTGTLLGIAGGLFHMLNHAIYKSCLFFSAGAVEKKAGTTNLEELGGFAKFMPLTFIIFLVTSFSISGVPPFNGFFSKWAVYQGVIETAKAGGSLWIIWLTAAMFGSVLTLASFMKLIHAVFLGQPLKKYKTKTSRDEIGALMWLPSAVLALLCILFGVFAYQIPWQNFIVPSIGKEVTFTGIWSPSLATVLLLVGIGVGFIIFLIAKAGEAKETEIFVGGEDIEEFPQMRESGTGFYNTIKEIGFLKLIYKLAEKKVFDIYEVGKKLTFGCNRVLAYLHNGVLPTYLAWCLLGMVILFYILFRPL